MSPSCVHTYGRLQHLILIRQFDVGVRPAVGSSKCGSQSVENSPDVWDGTGDVRGGVWGRVCVVPTVRAYICQKYICQVRHILGDKNSKMRDKNVIE